MVPTEQYVAGRDRYVLLMLDQLGVPSNARQLADLDTPLDDGTALPAPQGVFPRYVEPAV